jgi:hypothetical protein
MRGPSNHDALALDSVDLWTLISRDLESRQPNVLVDGRSDAKNRPLAWLWSSVANSDKIHLGTNDRFCAVIDMDATPSGMGVFTLTVPNGLGLRPYASSDSDGRPRKDICFGTAVTPTGWYSGPHCDFEGGTSCIVHLLGKKLWITFPRSAHNRKIMEPTMELAFGLDNINLLEVIDDLEDIAYHLLDSPSGFLLAPFEYHACLTLNTTIHVGGPLWPLKDVNPICTEINRMLNDWEADVRMKSCDVAVHERMTMTMTGMEAVVMGNRGGKDADMLRALRRRLDNLIA